MNFACSVNVNEMTARSMSETIRSLRRYYKFALLKSLETITEEEEVKQEELVTGQEEEQEERQEK